MTVTATAVAKTVTDAAPTNSTAAATILNRRDAADGHTVLHLAVISGNLPMVQYLLAAGADLDLVDNEEHSAVHWAVVCGQETTYTHMMFPKERLLYFTARPCTLFRSLSLFLLKVQYLHIYNNENSFGQQIRRP